MEQKELSLPAPEVSRTRRELARQFVSKLFKRNHAKVGVEYEEAGLDIFTQRLEVVQSSPEDVVPHASALPKREASLAIAQRVAGNNPEGFGLKITGSINEEPVDTAVNHYDPSKPKHLALRTAERRAQQDHIDELAAKRAEIAADPLRREVYVGKHASTPEEAALKAYNADFLGAPKETVPQGEDLIFKKLHDDFKPKVA